MNFYRLIEQQHDDYKADGYSLNSCKKCPCKTLRDKVFGTDNKPRSCISEMMLLVNKCNMDDTDGFAFFCDELRDTSVKIAKKLFGKKFNKI